MASIPPRPRPTPGSATMRVYLAAPYAARDVVRSYASELRRIDFTVTSSWLDEEHEINAGTTGAATGLDDTTVSGHAIKDLDDIRGSDVLVLFTPKAVDLAPIQTMSGGRHVETGYALALERPVIVVGEPENVFHRIQLGYEVEVVPDWHRAVLELVAMREVLARPDADPCGCVR